MASALVARAATVQDAPPTPIGPEISSTVTVKPVTDELVIRPARRPDDRPYLCRVSLSLPQEGSAMRQARSARLVLFTGERETASVDLPEGRVAQLACALDDEGRKAEVQVQVLAAGRIALLSRTAMWLPGGER